MSLAQRWLEIINADLEDYRKSETREPHPNEGIPSWAQGIEAELDRMLRPVRLKPDEALSPFKVGALLGQTYAYYGWVLDCMRRENSALADRFTREIKEDFEGDFSASIAEEMESMAEIGMVLGYTRFQHVVKRALCLACERPFVEAASFFDGFHSSVSKRADDDSIWTDKFSTASAYFVLLRHSEFVDTFRTVSDLHVFLQHKLGRNAAGDLDRTRTLAKRLKIKLAPRGRPTKKWAKVP